MSLSLSVCLNILLNKRDLLPINIHVKSSHALPFRVKPVTLKCGFCSTLTKTQPSLPE